MVINMEKIRQYLGIQRQNRQLCEEQATDVMTKATSPEGRVTAEKEESLETILNRHPSLTKYVRELSCLAEKFAKKAVEMQWEGKSRIRAETIEIACHREVFDKKGFQELMLERPEIEKIDCIDEDANDYYYEIKISEEYVYRNEASLKKLNKLEIEEMCAKHLLWLLEAGGEQADFSNSLLQDQSLCGKNLMNAIFDGAKLVNVNMHNAELCFSTFTGTGFYDCDLTEAVAEECECRGAGFYNTDLEGTIFTHSNLTNARFIDCSGSGGSLQNCCVENVEFDSLNLKFVDQSNTYKSEAEWQAEYSGRGIEL